MLWKNIISKQTQDDHCLMQIKRAISLSEEQYISDGTHTYNYSSIWVSKRQNFVVAVVVKNRVGVGDP